MHRDLAVERHGDRRRPGEDPGLRPAKLFDRRKGWTTSRRARRADRSGDRCRHRGVHVAEQAEGARSMDAPTSSASARAVRDGHHRGRSSASHDCRCQDSQRRPAAAEPHFGIGVFGARQESCVVRRILASLSDDGRSEGGARRHRMESAGNGAVQARSRSEPARRRAEGMWNGLRPSEFRS